MRRTFYVGVGFAVGVAATRRTRRAREAALAAITPASVAANVADGISEVGHALGSFITDVRAGMHQRETELVPVVDQRTGLVSMSPPELAGPNAQPAPLTQRDRSELRARAIGAVARSDRGWRTG